MGQDSGLAGQLSGSSFMEIGVTLPSSLVFWHLPVAVLRDIAGKQSSSISEIKKQNVKLMRKQSADVSTSTFSMD